MKEKRCESEKNTKGGKQQILFASWNLRSLVESEGSIATARSRQGEGVLRGSVERKADLMVEELNRYNIFAASISETKWFDCNIYEIGNHVMLHSGRASPKEGNKVDRGEGVGIVLSPSAVIAWRKGGAMPLHFDPLKR